MPVEDSEAINGSLLSPWCPSIMFGLWLEDWWTAFDPIGCSSQERTMFVQLDYRFGNQIQIVKNTILSYTFSVQANNPKK